MRYEARIYQMTVEDHTFWVAESKSLKGCVGQGDTSDEAIKELEENENEWLETAREVGIPIPDPVSKQPLQHNGKFALRLSPVEYSTASEYAKELGISVNQYFNDAIINYNSMVKNYLYKPLASKTVMDSKIINLDLKRRDKRTTRSVDFIEEDLKEM